MSDSIIVYYSFEGNTKVAADLLAQQTGAEMFRLKVEKEPPKKGLMKFIHGGKSALSKDLYELIDFDLDLDKYETVYLMFPIWAGTFPPAVNSFLKKDLISGKNVYLFASSASGNGNKAMDSIEEFLKDKNKIVSKINLLNPLKNTEATKKILSEIK